MPEWTSDSVAFPDYPGRSDAAPEPVGAGHFSPHRRRHRRQCDRCRRPATWNYTRRGHLTEYACDEHAWAIAVRDEIDAPRIGHSG